MFAVIAFFGGMGIFILCSDTSDFPILFNAIGVISIIVAIALLLLRISVMKSDILAKNQKKFYAQRYGKDCPKEGKGTWLMTISPEEKERYDSIEIYKDADGKTVVVDHRLLRAGVTTPSFSVQAAEFTAEKYHEAEITYTGVTSGGIHTGGFHVEGPYKTQHTTSSGLNAWICLFSDVNGGHIHHIDLNEELTKAAQQQPWSGLLSGSKLSLYNDSYFDKLVGSMPTTSASVGSLYYAMACLPTEQSRKVAVWLNQIFKA